MYLLVNELKKLWRIFLSDPKPAAAGVLAPSLIIICFSLIFGNFTSLPLAFVNLDNRENGKLFEKEIFSRISPLGNTTYFKKIECSIDKAKKLFRLGKVMGIIKIPENFSDKLLTGNNPVITFELRNYNTDIAKNLRLYLEEGIWAFYQRIYPDIQIEINEINESGPQVQWVSIIASGSIVLAFILGGMFCYIYLFFKERLKKTICFYALGTECLYYSFLARTLFALGIALVSGFVNTSLACLLTGNNILGPVITVFPALLMTAIVYISFAAIFTLIITDFYAANLISMFGAILIWFLSGGLHGGRPSDPILRTLSAITPNIYAQDIMTHTLFNMRYDSPWVNFTIIGIMTFVSFVVSGMLYKYKLQKGIS